MNIPEDIEQVRSTLRGSMFEGSFANIEFHIARLESDLAELREKLTYGVRKTDPSTSVKAWELTEKTRKTHVGRLYEVFLAYPDTRMTWEEAAGNAGIQPRSCPWHRLHDLVVYGKLTVCPEKRISPTTGFELTVYELRR